jgi:hypothetical protein
MKNCVWLLLLVASPAAAQQMTASGGMDPGSIVRTQLDNPRFKTPLPFDVQFYVRAPIDADVTEVQGKLARKRSSMTCEAIIQTIPTMPPQTSYQTGGGIRIIPARPAPFGTTPVASRPAPVPPPPPPPRAAPPPPGSARGWLGYGSLFVDNDVQPSPGRVFELSVPPLKPRQDYCFGFVLRMKTDPVDARAMVASAVDNRLRKLTDVRELSDPALYDQFRHDVIAALEDLRVAKEKTKPFPLVIEIPENSWFNVGTRALEITERYRADFTNVLRAQLGRANLLASVRTRSASATDAVRTLQLDPGFTTLVGALREHASNDLVATQVSRFESLLDIGARAAESVALGSDADLAVPPPPITSAWDPAAIDPRLTQLDRTIKELAAFVDAATSLSGNAGLRAATGVQAAAPGAAPNATAMSSEDLLKVASLAATARTSLNSLRNELSNLETVLAARSTALSTLAEQTATALENDITFSGTTMTDWKTRATAYISADVGVAYSGEIDSFFFYLGSNFYLGPVNKKAPLSFREDGFGSSIRKRLAIMLGIPINGFNDTTAVTLTTDTGVRLDGVIGSRPLLIGAGFRINDFVRLTGGSLFFKVADPNPLITDEKTRHSAFFAVSVDWDVRGMFGGLQGQTPAAASIR